MEYRVLRGRNQGLGPIGFRVRASRAWDIIGLWVEGAPNNDPHPHKKS